MTDDSSRGGDDFEKYHAALSRRFGQAIVASWMSDLKKEAETDDSVTLSTTSDLKRDTLDQRYSGPLKTAWCEEIRPIKRLLIIKRDALSSKAARIDGLAPNNGARPALNGHAGNGHAGASLFGGKKSRDDRRTLPLQELLSPLDERSTFDRFAVDQSNEMAYAAVRQVFVKGSPPDVIYVWGPSGVGKTHLLHAVGNQYRSLHGEGGCAYLTYHNLMNACVNAVFSNGILALHKELLAQEVVLIDDIHLLAGSNRTQTELLNLVNAFLAAGRRIVIAGELAPQKLAEAGINDRLADRLSGGLSVAVTPGDESLRAKVLKKRVESASASCSVTDEAIDYIARNFQQSMRETLGALNQLLLVHGQQETVIGPVEAATALKARLSQSRKKTTLEDLAAATAAAFDISLDDLKGRRHHQRFARARHAYVMIGRESLKDSFPRIARTLGRDHTTAMSGYQRAQALYERDPEFQAAIRAIKSELGLPID